MRRVRRALATAVLGAVAVSAAPASAAGVESGWWWKANPGSTAPLPPPIPLTQFPTPPPAPPAPPNVGEGDIVVAAAPDGPSAVAAVRIDTSATKLTLTVAENGDTGGAAAQIEACRVAFPWNPAAAGRWDDRPACDATTPPVTGTRSEDGATWEFSLGALSGEAGVDVLIQPAAGNVAPFQVVFRKPTAASFSGTGGSDGSVSFDPGPMPEFSGDFEATEPAFDPGPVDLGPAVDVFDLGGTTFSPVDPGAVTVPSEGPVELVTPPPAAPTVPATVPGREGSGARLLGALVLVFAGAAAYTVSRQPLPALVNLTRVRVGEAGPEPTPDALVPAAPQIQRGGLGRFARPRLGAPPSLR